MYERSAIVLERYVEKILEFNKKANLKKNSENYRELIDEIEEYQIMTNKELTVIQEFDNAAKKIEELQKEQEKLCKENRKLEDNREQLFNDLGEDAKVLDNKLKKIENILEKNNEQLKEIREEFIKYLSDFIQKQKDRNKCEKARRIGEANHIEYIKKMNVEFDEIDIKDVVNLKEFINCEKEQIKQEVLELMVKNGKNEKVAFDKDVFKKAIQARCDIAEKEAECYIILYDKMKKLLSETDNEFIKLNKYKKALRDTGVKLAFLKAEREYIVSFLDYERMTAISGTKIHKKMMIEACNNFELDMIQIKNLYELIQRETTNKATKKAYKELYNKTYLRNIEDKEKNFEEEVNNVKISMGTVINSNYWRIEGIKNIYNVFQEEVSEKFEKDLSDYRIEENDYEENQDYDQNNYGEKIEDEEYEDDYDEDIDDEEYEDEEYDEDDDDEYEDEEYDEDDDDEYEDEEYDEDEVDEYEDEEYDEDIEDDYDEEEIEEDDDDENYDEDDDNYQEVQYDEEEQLQEEKRKRGEGIFDEEDSIDEIIEKSRKKAVKTKRNKEENKGLFKKIFKK